MQKRVESAAGGRLSFTSLFADRTIFDDPLEYDKKLVQRSQGSLSHMLELGHHILLHHSQHHPDEPDLVAEDFLVLEKT